MATTLSIQDLNNNLAFLERVQLQGREAESLVQLRYKLIAMYEEAQLLEKQKAPPKKAAAKPPPKKAARKR